MNRELSNIMKQSKISAAVSGILNEREIRERLNALEQELPQIRNELKRMHSIAREVVDEKLSEIQTFMQDAVKVVGALMNESERHRKVINDATRKQT